jgi:hypothetical protein
MRSTRTRLIDLANASKGMVGALAFSTFLALTPSPVSAMVVAPSGLLQQQARQDTLVVARQAGPSFAAAPWRVRGPLYARDMPAAAYAGHGRVGTIGPGAEPSLPVLPSAL